MAEIEPVLTQRIVSTTLHHIDIDNGFATHMPMSSINADLEGYLTDLLKEIDGRAQKRTYSFLRSSTEFYVALKSFFTDQNLANNEAAAQIADRLLQKEIQTDARYGHLSSTGTGHVKKGSFLQFLYMEHGVLSYLGVKIEHQSFLDENDFKKKIGLAIENKIYKACKVTYDGVGTPGEVLVFDTNSKPATYWWQDFLELKETRDDSFNTRVASQEVIKLLNGLKNEFPADHTVLRNATIAAFKQNGTMKYDDFVKNTFQTYVPIDENLAGKMIRIVADLHALPEKKNFDSMFNLVPGEVAYKRSKVVLTKEISLTYDDGMDDLDEKIWAEKSPSGRKLVVIDSPSGFEKFRLKERKCL